MPYAWAKRVKSPKCSYQCNGQERGRQWKAHGHKGRAAWTPENERSYREKMSGSRNPSWKGGVTFFRKHGNYKPIKYVRCPAEFVAMARTDGYVMEHRVIMATWVGRSLDRTEVVHHEDHDPQNNGRQNLALWPTNRAHKLHEAGRLAIGAANRWHPKDSALPSSLDSSRSSSPASPSAAA